MRALFALVFLAMFTVGAAAQSCSSLKSQLAAAEAGKPNAAVVNAIERKSRSYGCDRPARLGRSSACDAIDAQLRQAKAGGINRPRVRRLRSQIATHCGEQKTWTEALRGPRRSTKGNRDNRDGNFITRLFGRSHEDDSEDFVESASTTPQRGVERVNLDTRRESSGSGSSYSALATRSRGREKGSSRYGNSRTMCVRLCDGFYFPINNNSHSDNYYDELAMCVGRCPGADVSLYVHSNGEAVERMRSTMTGEAYVTLPTAFAYRKSLSRSCSCANGTQLVRGGDAAPKMSLASATINDGIASDAKDESRWSPFRAVYDSTGEQLLPSQTSYGAFSSDADRRPVAALPGGPPENGDGNVGTPFDPAANTARPVGPQFFSEAVSDFAERKSHPAERRDRVLTTPVVITVTPLPLPRRETSEIAPAPAPAVTPAETSASPAEEISPGTSAMVVPEEVGAGG